MLKPVADIAAAAKSTLDKETIKIANCCSDTDKLMNAVFYKARKTKNIFHVMSD